MAKDDYSFEPFLETLGRNWFADDDLLRALLRDRAGFGARGTGAEEELGAWGEECAGRLRQLAEASARPENRPRLRRHDAYGNRVDRVLLPTSTVEALDVVEGREGLGAVSGDPFVHYAKVYLYSQNGEAGVACSVACTDGLVRVLEAVGSGPEHREAAEEIRTSRPGRVVHGAQFVTEIQGGSDVRANRTRAVPDGDGYRLYGRKWFCSNVNADHYLVTARPEPPAGASSEDDGSARNVALFLVRARGHRATSEAGAGHSADGRSAEARAASGHDAVSPRNGHTVDRLKEKLGTRELATAEVTFDGAAAVAVGPLDRGLRILLRHVLAPSRFGCVIFAASALRRAERIAEAYAGFRTAFGRTIGEYPQVGASLSSLRRARARSLSAVFRLLELWEGARADSGWTDPQTVPAAGRPEALDFRVMLSLCKAELTRACTRELHEAAMLLGGNGLMEDFSPLPRLYRDSVVMEAWEGPRNVLLAQARRDLQRFEVEPDAFVARVVGSRRDDLAGDLADVLAGAAEESPRGGPEPAPSVAFGRLAGRLVAAFAEEGLPDGFGQGQKGRSL